MASELYSPEQRDTTLIIDNDDLIDCIDYVREGLKRMVNNHEFWNPAPVITTIQMLDWLSSTRHASEREAADAFPEGARQHEEHRQRTRKIGRVEDRNR